MQDLTPRERLLRIERTIGDAIYLLDESAPDAKAAMLKLLVAMNLLDDELRPPPRFSRQTWERIDRAAQMRVEGKTWMELDALIGESFCRDLRSPTRYKKWFRRYLETWKLNKLIERARRNRPA